VNKQLSSNLLILSPQVISRPRGGSHNWVQQTPQSFETTILDIPQIISTPRGGSHDWVQQTPQSFEITILESITKHRIQTKF
jgi:2-C-methyl-D-erythritol 4-phosphate cytidylyltransferase